MQAAKRRIPHFTYVEEVDVTELERLRAAAERRQLDGARPKLTVLPFLMRAVVRAVRDHPEMNARFDDEAGVRQPPPSRPPGHRHADAEGV